MSRPAALTIVRRLREHGHVAYLAGGCVRDRLMGLEPRDHDVATDATPQVVQQLFPRSQPVGEAFGVVLVYVRPPTPTHADAERSEASVTRARRVAVEVATFRTEGVYSDGRHPDEVSFSDARHDAQRRDFTINGLFEYPGESRGQGVEGPRGRRGTEPELRELDDGSVILDYVGGLADLETQTLRAIGQPARRFAEDYLRMLRAVRFATRLGFTLDPATAEAIRGHADRLERISRERIGGELRAMLTAVNRPRPAAPAAAPAGAAALLQQLRLDGPTLGEPCREVALPVLNRLAPGAAYPAALACWMIDRHGLPDSTARPPARVAVWRKALCLSNDETDTLGRVLRQAVAAEAWPTMNVAQRKRLLSATDFDQTRLVLRAMGKADDIEADWPGLRDDGVGLAPPPLIDGGDLIQLGLKPGPRFKTLLDDAYDAQLDGRLTDKAQALGWVRDRGDQR